MIIVHHPNVRHPSTSHTNLRSLSLLSNSSECYTTQDTVTTHDTHDTHDMSADTTTMYESFSASSSQCSTPRAIPSVGMAFMDEAWLPKPAIHAWVSCAMVIQHLIDHEAACRHALTQQCNIQLAALQRWERKQKPLWVLHRMFRRFFDGKNLAIAASQLQHRRAARARCLEEKEEAERRQAAAVLLQSLARRVYAVEVLLSQQFDGVWV
mmetsp:Transcript_141338/g.246424  ORF Transcript_141338/g.246424 Transcript_141338/m.246424 type:complete len:210 (-) Transcript_141338:115-744(-)